MGDFVFRGYRILRIFERIKKHPNRVYLVTDFLPSPKNYLELLVNLGLLEKVSVVFRGGNNNSFRKSLEGYKLLRCVNEE